MRLPTSFVVSFQATFIFGESQSELSIKSYGQLKFFRPKIFETQNLLYNHTESISKRICVGHSNKFTIKKEYLKVHSRANHKSFHHNTHTTFDSRFGKLFGSFKIA